MPLGAKNSEIGRDTDQWSRPQGEKAKVELSFSGMVHLESTVSTTCLIGCDL
jgi:hypothetical protein